MAHTHCAQTLSTPRNLEEKKIESHFCFIHQLIEIIKYFKNENKNIRSR